MPAAVLGPVNVAAKGVQAGKESVAGADPRQSLWNLGRGQGGREVFLGRRQLGPSPPGLEVRTLEVAPGACADEQPRPIQREPHPVDTAGGGGGEENLDRRVANPPPVRPDGHAAWSQRLGEGRHARQQPWEQERR